MPIPPNQAVPPSTSALPSFFQVLKLQVNGVDQVMTTSDNVLTGPRILDFDGSGASLDPATLTMHVPMGGGGGGAGVRTFADIPGMVAAEGVATGTLALITGSPFGLFVRDVASTLVPNNIDVYAAADGGNWILED